MKKSILSLSLGLAFGMASFQSVHAMSGEAQSKLVTAVVGEREQGVEEQQEEKGTQDGASLEMLLNVAEAPAEGGDDEKKDEQGSPDGASIDTDLQLATADASGDSGKDGDKDTQDDAPQGT